MNLIGKWSEKKKQKNMKTIFKKITFIPALIFAGMLTAPAQQYGLLSTIANGSTYIAGASAATNIAGTVTCARWDEFDLEVSFKMMAAGTSNIDLAWSTSNNGTTYATVKDQSAAGWFTMCIGDGTTLVSWRTNITMHSAGYWKLDYLTNGNTAVITNLTIKAYGKPKRQG